MESVRDNKTSKWKFALKIGKDDLDSEGYITRERYHELLNEDLKTGGYEITGVDYDFLGGTCLTIKAPDGTFAITYVEQRFPNKMKVHFQEGA